MLKKFFSLLIIMTTCFTCFNVSAANDNLIPQADSEMSKGNNWAPFDGGTISVINMKIATGANNTVLKVTNLGERTWYTPSLQIFEFIRDDVKKNGAGRYMISFEYMLEGEEDKEYNLNTMIRSSSPMKVLTHSNDNNTEYRGSLGRINGKTGVWRTFNSTFGVLAEDVQNEKTTWKFCFDGFPQDLTTIYVDDFKITRITAKDVNDVSVMGTVTAESVKFKGAEDVLSKNENTENKSNTQKGINLVDEKISTFENINSVEESSWMGFSTVNLSIDTGGYRGSCLKMTTPQNTWGSPSIDIFPYIKESGTYSISMFVKFDGETEQNLSFVLRGTRENSFITAQGTNFFVNIGSQKVQPGKWTKLTAQFAVKDEDISEKDSWKLCFSTIKPEIKAIYIDDFVLTRGSFGEETDEKLSDSTEFQDKIEISEQEKTQTSMQKGVNLLEEKTSTFENVKFVQESTWTGFSAGELSIDAGGYSGSCLKMTTPQNTWGSPTIDIFPYIKEAGTYSISMFVKFDGEKEQTLPLVLRGTRENSFITAQGTNFFVNIGSQKVQPGKWTKMTAQFVVKEEDVAQKDNWKLCFSTIKPEIKALYIDDVVLIRGRFEAETDELYTPQITKVAIVTSIVTAVIVALTITLKIVIPRKFKRGKEK